MFIVFENWCKPCASHFFESLSTSFLSYKVKMGIAKWWILVKRNGNLQKLGYEFHIYQDTWNGNLPTFLFSSKGIPLNIPTPTPAPDHLLRGHGRTWGTRVVGELGDQQRLQECNYYKHMFGVFPCSSWLKPGSVTTQSRNLLDSFECLGRADMGRVYVSGMQWQAMNFCYHVSAQRFGITSQWNGISITLQKSSSVHRNLFVWSY